MRRRPMPEKSQSKQSKWKPALWGIGILLIPLISVLAFSLSQRHRTHKEATARKEELKRGPKVTVAQAEHSPEYRQVELIGEARPFLTTQVFARASGYLKEIYVDKGDTVKEGQTLAIIESPETDRAYLAALADAENKKRIAIRSSALLKRKLISQQEGDQSFANSDISIANFEIQKTLKGYTTLRAPFSGRITARFVDPGALLQNATNAQSSSQVLFTLSQTKRLRIYVYVDQSDSPSVRAGVPAEIYLRENPETELKGEVTRVAGELDLRTRTMLTEIDLENQDEKIIPGSFVQVKLMIPTPQSVEVPVKALVFKNNKAFVQVVSADHTLRYRPVTVGESTGEKLKILSGLEAGETVALNLGNSVPDGQKIQIQQMAGQATENGK